MATLSEIYHLVKDDTPLREAVIAACLVEASAITAETGGVNLVNRQAWAKEVMIDPFQATKSMWKNVITKSAVLGIPNPTDMQIQSTVSGLVDFHANGS